MTDALLPPWMVAAILAEPACPALRLAAADLLEEAGAADKADWLRQEGKWSIIDPNLCYGPAPYNTTVNRKCVGVVPRALKPPCSNPLLRDHGYCVIQSAIYGKWRCCYHIH